jgi:nucleoside-diphosphate-sugar epimerase
MYGALIGYTGFVGGNLARQARFTDVYNSRNVEMIAGRQFDILVCAAAPGVKWKANADPENDRLAIARLQGHLAQVKVKKLVLISTVDVYRQPAGVDEETPIDSAQLAPYGQHRFELEQFVSSRFDALVVRLPALFGPGLKKNIIYDFLHGNCLDKIHCDSVFQFYAIDRLWTEIQRALDYGLKLINFATEPVSVAEVAEHGFGWSFRNRLEVPPAHYDMKTRFAHLYGGCRGYLHQKEEVLTALREFVQSQQGRAA